MNSSENGNLSNGVIVDESGKPVALIEVSGVDAAVAAQLQGLRGVRETTESLSTIGVGIAATCRQIIGSVRDNLNDIKPSEFEIKFGVKISAEGGLPLITKAKGEATIEVRATWREENINRQS